MINKIVNWTEFKKEKKKKEKKDNNNSVSLITKVGYTKQHSDIMMCMVHIKSRGGKTQKNKNKNTQWLKIKLNKLPKQTRTPDRQTEMFFRWTKTRS